MKRFLLLVAALLSAGLHLTRAQELRYVDASTLTIINKAQPDRGPAFERLDVGRYPDLPKTVNRYFRYATGLAVVFRTDSRNIRARWSTVERLPRANNTLICQRGLDLYIRRGGEWIFAGVGSPNNKGLDTEAPVAVNMAEGEKECLLYLPLFDRLTSLEIGVDADASIEPLENPFRRKVVVLGSSITHGSGASRPGMAYPARLERRTGLQFVNLGVSGLCKMEPFFARIIADTEADAFLFDTFSNPSGEQIDERLADFVRTIRQAHPDVPLIFLQTEVRETGNFNERKRRFEAKKREAAVRGMKKLLKKDPNIYFIDPGMPLGDDHEATVDGVHPTDLGYTRIIDCIEPQISRIIRKSGK